MTYWERKKQMTFVSAFSGTVLLLQSKTLMIRPVFYSFSESLTMSAFKIFIFKFFSFIFILFIIPLPMDTFS